MFGKGNQMVDNEMVRENVYRALLNSGYAESTAKMMAKDWTLMRQSESTKVKMKAALTN